MRIVFGWVLSLGVLCTSGVVGAQDFFPESKPFFELLAEKTQGRIKQALMENIDGQPGDELIILERRGQYPQWKGALSVWNIDERGLKQRGEITFPDDVIYFGFVKPNVDDLSLVLRTKAGIQIGVWKLDHWAFQPKHQLVRDLQPSLIDSSYARYYPLVQETLGDRQVLFLPSVMGLDVVQIPFGKNVESVSQLTDIRRAYNRSPLGVLPFEPQFVYQFMFWFPSLRVQKQNSGVTLYSSWMDEVQIIELSPQLKVQSKEVRRFHLLSEDERNSGVSFVNTDAMDINHDGIVDYMSNQFTGSGTNFSAKTRLFFQKEGSINEKGEEISLKKDATSGAVMKDVDQDGDFDLIFASSQFTFGAIVRAITKKQIQIEFDFFKYDQQKQTYHLNRPDLTRQIDFAFSLRQFFIDGILPNLDGDYNGDGFPDAMYARSDKELSFLIQNPSSPQFFPSIPSATYDIDLPGDYVVGDLNGDGKDEVVLYGTSAGKDQRMYVLKNLGRW